MPAASSEEVRTKCYSCGDRMSVPKEAIAQSGKEVYCQDCLIQAECRQCGRSVQTTHEKFAQFDGKPVCNDCADGPVDLSKPMPDMDGGGVLGRRVVAAVIDLIAPFVAVVIFEAAMNALNIVSILGVSTSNLAFSLFGIALIYNFIVLEGETGQSFGKELMGIMVAKKNGSSCGYTSAVIRNVLRPIDLILAYGVGFMFIAMTPGNQRFGDYFARTVVVPVNE